VRRIVRGAEIARQRTVRVDACVIGSGAGGAVAAKELAEGGMSVAILEEGEWWETDEFNARPREMMGRLYRDAGQSATVGTPAIILPTGRAVGGTTLVNSGTCFRTPDAVLERWADHDGLSGWAGGGLDPYFCRVERELNVSQVPADLAGRNAEVVRRGVEALGWSGDFVYRNVRGCVGSGVCAFGCPSGAKQHVGITYVPRAWAAGASTYTGVRAKRVELSGGRAREVVAQTTGGGRLTVRCDHVVVACGALQTPGLLARSGVRAPALGANLAIHPATAARALFDERIDMWRGVPQSYYVDEFAPEGIMLEGIAGPPDQLAMSIQASGAPLRAAMLGYPRTAQFGVMVADSSRGQVRTIAGRPAVRYDLNSRDTALFKHGLERLAEIYWAAGAREVTVPVRGVPVLRDGDSGPLRRARVRPRDLYALAFHPLGSARAGADPAISVVGGEGAVHGVAGLHVVDASVIPGSPGVNPQITIMALASRTAFSLLDRPAPVDEPEPEHIAQVRSARLPAAA
jgi:choline dehydrogenase-like flavoprotein